MAIDWSLPQVRLSPSDFTPLAEGIGGVFEACHRREEERRKALLVLARSLAIDVCLHMMDVASARSETVADASWPVPAAVQSRPLH